MERLTLDGRSLPERIGEVAGRVWRQLRGHGPQSLREIAHAIGRTEPDVHQALGWLAREGKLKMEPDHRLSLVEQEMSVDI